MSLLERLDVPRTAVTHTGANTADQLENRFRKHSLEGHTGHDTFRDQFIDIHIALLEVAVGRTGFHSVQRPHAAIALELAAGKASARARAVRIVAAAGVSERELQKRLVQKGEEAADAKEAVGWLKELHLLDDGETARQLVASAAAKGYGKSRIKNILYEKGIPQEFWDDALANLPEMDDAIDRFLARRWQGKDPDDKEVKRTVDALIRRGHSWKDIQAGLRRYRADLELEENTEDYIP